MKRPPIPNAILNAIPNGLKATGFKANGSKARPLGVSLRASLLAAMIAAMIAPPAMAQDAPAPRTDAEIKALVLEAIRENPTIIEEAVQLLREADEAAQVAAARAVLDDRAAMEDGAPVMGNPDGDVTVVEFLDYNCGYCKRAIGEVRALMEADPGVRLVVREWPILSEGSVVAARAALAADRQGRYAEMHEALMALPRADEETVMQTAERLGLDMARLEADMADPAVDAHFDRSHELTRAFGFSGTPSFVIGDELVPGAVPMDTMRAMVEAAREAG